jgi:NADH:ubiquinone oxidoreductase subunit 3 (subunit A)
MENFLLFPPIAFIIFLLLYWGLSKLLRSLSAKGKENAGKETAYACGQTVETGRIQPNYHEFFPFVFFFTIIHAVVLMIATMPSGALWQAIVFLAAILLSLRILFRR